MDFEEQYLTYDDYKDLGGSIAETPFNLLEYEAQKQIDIRTQNRLKNADEIPDAVKLCVFRLIDIINSYENESVNKNVSSENTDGYSVSYITANQIQENVKAKNNEIEDIIMNYLFGVVINGEHLIYNGVS